MNQSDINESPMIIVFIIFAAIFACIVVSAIILGGGL